MKNTVSIIIFFSLGFAFNSHAVTPISNFFFDKPLAQQKTLLGKSIDAPPGMVTSTCFRFEEFAVVELNDPAIKGAKEVKLLRGKPYADFCAKDFSGTTISLPEIAGTYYFKGVVNNYVFFDGADSFGNQIDFTIVSSQTGKTILTEWRDDSKSMFLSKSKELAKSLRFYKSLKVTCPLAKDGTSCWEKIKNENNIPKTANLKMPDCKTSFAKINSPLDNRALVSVPVVIDDLQKPVVTFESGQTYCEPAP